jgi:hypothetical protein
MRLDVRRISMATQAGLVVASMGMQAWAIEPQRERPGEAMLDTFGSIFE